MAVAQIQPVQIINNTATQLSSYVINYDLTGQSCELYWWLSDSNNNMLFTGNYAVPSSILQSWGTNDNLIIDSLAADKGFTITSYGPVGATNS
jgi:hypothetical protein